MTNETQIISEDGFQKDLQRLINHYAKEDGSATPDFILAEYLSDCLDAWNKSVMRRSKWHGGRDRIDYLVKHP